MSRPKFLLSIMLVKELKLPDSETSLSSYCTWLQPYVWTTKAPINKIKRIK